MQLEERIAIQSYQFLSVKGGGGGDACIVKEIRSAQISGDFWLVWKFDKVCFPCLQFFPFKKRFWLYTDNIKNRCFSSFLLAGGY